MITSSKKKLISAVEKRIGGKISRIGIDKIENYLPNYFTFSRLKTASLKDLLNAPLNARLIVLKGCDLTLTAPCLIAYSSSSFFGLFQRLNVSLYNGSLNDLIYQTSNRHLFEYVQFENDLTFYQNGKKQNSIDDLDFKKSFVGVSISTIENNKVIINYVPNFN